MRIFKRTWTDKSGVTHESAEWFLEYRVGGRQHSHKTYPPTTSKREAESQLRRYAVGYDTVRPRSATVSHVMTAYAEHLQRESPKTWRKCHVRVTWWADRYGDLDAAELTLDEIGKATVELRKGRSPGTVYGYLSSLRAALNRAILSGVLAFHPASKMEIRDRSPKRRVLIPRDAMERVCARLPGWAAGVVRVSRETGLRLGDCLRLRWENVEPFRLVWTMEKGGRDWEIPLTDAGRAVLDSLPRHDTVYVFPRPPRRKKQGSTEPDRQPTTYDTSAFYDVWWPALEAEGLSARGGPGKARTRRGVTFHDLRRTWASELLNTGATKPEIASLLGQGSTSATDHYTVHELERLREVAQRAVDRRKPHPRRDPGSDEGEKV